jgi:hypothetical protein
MLSQISAGSAVPLAAILFLALPDDPSTAFMHGLVLVVMGFATAWNAPATNKYVKRTFSISTIFNFRIY